MIVTKFHEYRLIIDREINEKHALLIECGPGYRGVKRFPNATAKNLSILRYFLL